MNTQYGIKATGIGAVQGDIPSRYIAKLPKGAKPRKSNVIALGEATGHHHILEVVDENATLYEDGLGNLFALVKAPTRLLHNQHGYVEYAPGIVQFGEKGAMQVEYDGEEERAMLD